jgi:Tfp pilus assembly PilM family ATPase/Tfp pilus assembly protein PilN
MDESSVVMKRCIGIDIGRSYLCAVQMARTPDGVIIEKSLGIQTRRSTDSLPRILQSLATEHGFDRRADVAVSMPAHAVSFAEIQTDAAGLQALRTGEALGLRDDLPIPIEDAIIQVCSARALPKGQYGVLVAATPGALIQERLQLLDEARVRPVAMDAPIVAIHAAVAKNHPDLTKGMVLIVCIDESNLTLAVSQDGNILIVRNIPVLCDQGAELSVEQTTEIVEREVEITWRKLFGANPDKDLCILLISAPRTAESLAAAIQERIECRIVIADPYANVKRVNDDVDAGFPVYTAEGLALRVLYDQTDRSDFLAAYNARMRPDWSIKRELLACAALLVVTAAVWFAGLFIRLSALESQYAQLKEQMNSVFHQALPEERNIVNPMAQIQQRIDAFRKECELFSSFRPGRFSPLEIMYMLTAHAPKEGSLKLHDVLITGDSVQAIGSCDSFAVVSDWQRLLRRIPGFDAVSIQDQKKDAQTGRVRFTLAMSSTRMEQ